MSYVLYKKSLIVEMKPPFFVLVLLIPFLALDLSAIEKPSPDIGDLIATMRVTQDGKYALLSANTCGAVLTVVELLNLKKTGLSRDQELAINYFSKFPGSKLNDVQPISVAYYNWILEGARSAAKSNASIADIKEYGRRTKILEEDSNLCVSFFKVLP